MSGLQEAPAFARVGGWPIFMRRAMAAQYVGGDPILKVLEERYGVAPLTGTDAMPGGRRYAKADLDRAAARACMEGVE